MAIKIRDSPVPQRDPDPAFDNFFELRTVDDLTEADDHRVQINSLMGTYSNTLKESKF